MMGKDEVLFGMLIKRNVLVYPSILFKDKLDGFLPAKIPEVMVR